MASGLLIDYLGHGNAADRPATPDLYAGAIGLWWSDDTDELSVWNGVAWNAVSGGGGGSVSSVNGQTGAVVLDQSDIAAPVRTETSSYTAALSDCVIQMNVGSANNFTVPPNSSVAFPVGSFLEVWQQGSGQTTVVAGSGVTILYDADDALKLKGQNSGCSLRKVATNTWRLIGKMEAV